MLLRKKTLTVFLLSVKAACWSPDGKVLVFAVANEPAMYSLQFQDQIGEHIEQQIADVSADQTVHSSLTPIKTPLKRNQNPFFRAWLKVMSKTAWPRAML